MRESRSAAVSVVDTHGLHRAAIVSRTVRSGASKKAIAEACQSAGLFFLNGKPLDFSGFREKGGVTFDVNIKSLADNATLTLEMMCGENCVRKTSLSRFAKAHLNKGWQSVAVSLECFKGDETDFKKIDQPFNIEARGSGELEFTHIRFLATIENPIPCELVQP